MRAKLRVAQTVLTPTELASESINCKSTCCGKSVSRRLTVPDLHCGCTGTTSQPCMGAIVNALAGTDGDTGVAPAELLPLITFWEQTRGLYRPFESDMRSPSTDVYLHEMPGEHILCP